MARLSSPTDLSGNQKMGLSGCIGTSILSQGLHANKGYTRLRTQGILALSDCGPEDGGFFCVPGSHLVVRAWAHRNGETVSDKQLMNPESGCQIHLPPNDELKHNAQKAPIRRGSLLIWDAR